MAGSLDSPLLIHFRFFLLGLSSLSASRGERGRPCVRDIELAILWTEGQDGYSAYVECEYVQSQTRTRFRFPLSTCQLRYISNQPGGISISQPVKQCHHSSQKGTVHAEFGTPPPPARPMRPPLQWRYRRYAHACQRHFPNPNTGWYDSVSLTGTPTRQSQAGPVFARFLLALPSPPSVRWFSTSRSSGSSRSFSA